jgi:hypothetical protein
MMPSFIPRRIASLGLPTLFIVASMLAFAAPLQAQVLSDPRIAEFDPSPDHSVVLDNGEPAVLRYELGVYPLGGSAAVGTVDMGKPSPDADGKIRYDFSAPVAAWSLPYGEYEARVSAIGPQGSALSDPSNPFTFTTGSACTFSLSATSLPALASGGDYSVNVTAGPGCEWAAATTLPWVTMWTGGGSGGGTVPFTVEANTSLSSRTGTLEIAGQTLTVSQPAGAQPCSYSLSSSSASVPAAGGKASFSVMAGTGCAWTAVSSDAWISVAAASGTVSLAVAANPSTVPRTGTVSVQGQVFTLIQAGAESTCSFSVTPAVFSFDNAGGSGKVVITTGTGCAWAAVSNQSWLVPTVTNGTGSTGLTFTVKANNAITNRTGTLTVGPWAITVFQSGKPRRTK